MDKNFRNLLGNPPVISDKLTEDSINGIKFRQITEEKLDPCGRLRRNPSWSMEKKENLKKWFIDYTIWVWIKNYREMYKRQHHLLPKEKENFEITFDFGGITLAAAVAKDHNVLLSRNIQSAIWKNLKKNKKHFRRNVIHNPRYFEHPLENDRRNRSKNSWGNTSVLTCLVGYWYCAMRTEGVSIGKICYPLRNCYRYNDDIQKHVINTSP